MHSGDGLGLGLGLKVGGSETYFHTHICMHARQGCEACGLMRVGRSFNRVRVRVRVRVKVRVGVM